MTARVALAAYILAEQEATRAYLDYTRLAASEAVVHRAQKRQVDALTALTDVLDRLEAAAMEASR